MNTHRAPRNGRAKGISRKAAEQLLDGTAGPGRLTDVIAAATAPPRADELAGEDMAVAAFEMGHLIPASTSPTDQEHKSMLGKLLTIKFLAAAMAVTATGGVALAATTGAFSGAVPATATRPASLPATTGPSPAPADHSPTAQPLPSGTVTAPAPVSSSAEPSVSPSATASTPAAPGLPQTAAGLCRTLAAAALPSGSNVSASRMISGLASAKVAGLLSGSTKFGTLTSVAGSIANVPDYCALLLALPQLPDPAALAQLPATALSTLLSALPVATLSQILTQLPAATLDAVLSKLPASALSSVLSSLPSAVLSRLFAELPISTVSSLLGSLPSAVAAQLLSELPASLLSQLPTSLLHGLGL